MGFSNIVAEELNSMENPQQREVLQRFFKTGKGDYGEGDIFLGIKVPEQRKVAQKHSTIELSHIKDLLQSPIHEHRLTALFILIQHYENGDADYKENVVKTYLQNTKGVNNWDLVDLSAPKLLGKHLLHKERDVLYLLARSSDLWERRISMIATYAFIREGDFEDALKIAELLLKDNHDLMHKAVGWMLREIGKKDQSVEEAFLKQYHKTMPRTMLRYAIERFDAKKKKFYMAK